MNHFKKIFFYTLFLAAAFSAYAIMPAQAAAATLYFAPSSGTYVIGSSFTVSVKVNSGGVDVNAAEGGISFDTNLLEVTGVSKGGSIFPFWTVSPGFSNSAGTINFGGGMPPPAYKGTAGHIISVTFRAKKAGKAAVRFNSGAVLANDGKGTNILASIGSAAYVVSPKVTAPPIEKPAANSDKRDEPKKEVEKAEPDYNKPNITSDTHRENEWSNNNDVEFKWELPDEVTGVSISFDNNPTSDPGPKSDGLFSEKTFTDVEDGVWYLHLKFEDSKRWGTIEHYRIMIDTVAPDPFEAFIREIRIGEWPILEFNTTDKDSGMDRYELFVGSLEEQEHVLEPEIKELKLVNLEVGDHAAIVRAVDKAGNETIASVDFKIESIQAPEIVDYPREFKSSDKFYVSGKAFESAKINIYIQENGTLIASSTVMSDDAGKWFYLHEKNLANGRYVVWAVAVNDVGIKSGMSEKKTFLVTPPVFVMIGAFVVDYFTVFVSLLFMILIIIALIIFIVGLFRKKLRKETFEIEDVLHENLKQYTKSIDQEFAKLKNFEGTVNYTKEKVKIKNAMKKKLVVVESKIMKEVRDVEKILK
jgi:hypothetical protein